MGEPRIPVFRQARRIGEREIDQLGHVNNVVWVRFVVELAEAHAEALGLGYEESVRLGGVWVVRHHDVHYERAARPGDEVVGETWVTEMRGARSTRHACFTDGSDRVYLRARSDWAWVDPDSGRPRRIPPEVLRSFDVVAER